MSVVSVSVGNIPRVSGDSYIHKANIALTNDIILFLVSFRYLSHEIVLWVNIYPVTLC
jgi:hypothetical protein